jgi:hypothetical protein
MEVHVGAGQYTALSTRLEHYGTKSRIAMRAGRQYGKKEVPIGFISHFSYKVYKIMIHKAESGI